MLRFRKFQATGNDFIVLEGVHPESLSEEERRRLCDRHFGVGADGIVHIGPTVGRVSASEPGRASEIRQFFYWNADGRPGSFCGNGARVATWIAYQERPFTEALLIASDGEHRVEVRRSRPPLIAVELFVRKAPAQIGEGVWFVDTGSPHVLYKVPSVAEWETFPLTDWAPKTWRWRTDLDPGGVNVSVFAQGDGRWHLRTYERGVEAETLSCGTACVALAALLEKERRDTFLISITTRGGLLQVEYKTGTFWLVGPVEEVFRGEWCGAS